MAFKGVGSLDPHGGPVLRRVTLSNSVIMAVEDAVQVNASGFLRLGVAASLMAGNVRALQTFDGVGLDTSGVAGAAIGSFAGTYTAASDNQTVAQVSALVDVSKTTLYSADPDATIATTTGSDLLGYHTDIVSARSTDEDTAVLTTAQYHIWGVDPADSGNQIVSIYESLFFGV